MGQGQLQQSCSWPFMVIGSQSFEPVSLCDRKWAETRKFLAQKIYSCTIVCYRLYDFAAMPLHLSNTWFPLILGGLCTPWGLWGRIGRGAGWVLTAIPWHGKTCIYLTGQKFVQRHILLWTKRDACTSNTVCFCAWWLPCPVGQTHSSVGLVLSFWWLWLFQPCISLSAPFPQLLLILLPSHHSPVAVRIYLVWAPTCSPWLIQFVKGLNGVIVYFHQ